MAARCLRLIVLRPNTYTLLEQIVQLCDRGSLRGNDQHTVAVFPLLEVFSDLVNFFFFLKKLAKLVIIIKFKLKFSIEK